MGEAAPDPADAVIHAEVGGACRPEAPKAAEQGQPPDPGKDAPAPAHSGKVVDLPPPVTRRPRRRKKEGRQKPPAERQGRQAWQRSSAQGWQGRSR